MHGLTGDVVSHIYRRGLQVQTPEGTDANYGVYQHAMDAPVWGKAMLAFTVVFFGLLLVSVRYTIWGIMPTLTAIETPETTVIVKEEKPKLVDALAEENIDEEVLVINHKPITSKIRTTIRHLQARAGFTARWRGLSVFIVYMFAHGAMTEFFQGLAINMAGLQAFGFAGVYGGRMIGSVISSIALARLFMTWNHVVISESSPKSWFRRVPSFKTFKNIWAPTAILDIASRLPLVVPAMFASATNMHNLDASASCLTAKVLTVFMLGVVTFFGFAIPAYVALARVQASMLPEEYESIVPFDRTFNGKVVPQILGGTGAIGYVDAWRSYDRPARLRMFKLIVKNLMIETALHVFFAGVLVAEVAMIVGPENIRKAIKHGQS